MARIPDPDRSSLSADEQQALDALPDLALFRMLGHARTVIGPWLALGGTLLGSMELSARRRELAILAVAQAAECRYEQVQHEDIAAAIGVTAQEIAAIAHGDLDALGPADAVVVRLATEAVSKVEVSAPTIAAVQAELGDRQTVELLCLVGYYLATAIVARSTAIDIDAPARLAAVEASERFAGR